jgi:hypothetical protein
MEGIMICAVLYFSATRPMMTDTNHMIMDIWIDVMMALQNKTQDWVLLHHTLCRKQMSCFWSTERKPIQTSRMSQRNLFGKLY